MSRSLVRHRPGTVIHLSAYVGRAGSFAGGGAVHGLVLGCLESAKPLNASSAMQASPNNPFLTERARRASL